MEPDLSAVFLRTSAARLRQSASRVQECLGRLDDGQIWARAGEPSNAIGNLVLHLCGNLRQWIGYGVARQPDIRERDREFSARGDLSRAELRERLQAVVDQAAGVIETLSAERLAETVTVQKYRLTLLEAIYHVVEHFAQHTGQIIFATKQITGQDLGFYAHLNRPGEHGEKTP